ncbi:MAG: 3'-5' exonuclease domain-containing protein 2 [Candidatus Aminicenantes bacterium]|nr:3'-5' exonuclease domain-containing protein 2 [Candidatus Aminicenantes bacterium]
MKKYEGPVQIVDSDEGLGAAVARLRRERVLGFDIEVRPSFRSGDHFPPALVQLAAPDFVLLVQLKKIDAFAPLSALFAAGLAIKAGVAIANDIAKLHEVMRFAPAGFVDLGRMAATKGIKAGGVRTLAAQLLGLRISKGAQCSNWERSELSPAQVSYAATDAWICREIFLRLEKMPDMAKKKPSRSVSVSDSVSENLPERK